jgi:hypothetical protein
MLINHYGGQAVGLTGKDGGLIRARKMQMPDKDNPGKFLDIGFVGEIDGINPAVVKALQDDAFIPIISPIGFGEDGQAYNINADLVAGKIAEILRAEKLIMMTNIPGVLDKNGDVDNDKTLEIYCKAALAQARAGAHVVAPSGMMDGQVGAIRHALDTAGFNNVAIMAYSAKYASGLYGPFRDAVDVQIAGGGNRKGYQQDWRNARESMREVLADIEQGADIVMIKPALSYLDVISSVRARVDVPIAAYHVSGEYAMIKAAAANGWIDHDTVALEQLTAVKRAGADIILTYFARWFAENNR